MEEQSMLEYETLLDAAIQLPAGKKVQLIEALWDTVPEESIPPLSEEWLAEIQRRSDGFDTATVPWEVVRSEAARRANLAIRTGIIELAKFGSIFITH